MKIKKVVYQVKFKDRIALNYYVYKVSKNYYLINGADAVYAKSRKKALEKYLGSISDYNKVKDKVKIKKLCDEYFDILGEE